MRYRIAVIATLFLCSLHSAQANEMTVVAFRSGDLLLRGELYKPPGEGPFPALLYNHGSAPKMLNSQAAKAIGPKLVERGWLFFMPYRRGQGLSEDQGPYIMDEIRAAQWSLFDSASQALVRLLSGDHLNDQMAALSWLKQQSFVIKERIATMGNSFGGIQVLLGMARGEYCAGVNAAGGAQSWAQSEQLQTLMKQAVEKIHNPVFYFQAQNDYDVSPSRVLSDAMNQAGGTARLKLYAKFGDSKKQGHSFPYRGVSIWFDDAFQFIDRHCAQ